MWRASLGIFKGGENNCPLYMINRYILNIIIYSKTLIQQLTDNKILFKIKYNSKI